MTDGSDLKVWCGYCQAYINRETSVEHYRTHAKRLEHSSGPTKDEMEGKP